MSTRILVPAAAVMALVLGLAGVDGLHRAGELCDAAEMGDTQQVAALLSRGVSPDAGSWLTLGRAPLHRAAEHNQAAVVRLLAERGATLNLACGNGNTALAEAAASGQVAAMKALLEAGAQVNACDCDGDSPLCIAASYGQAEATVCLIDAGADVNWRSSQGTPLDLARRHHHPEVERLLAEHGGVSARP